MSDEQARPAASGWLYAALRCSTLLYAALRCSTRQLHLFGGALPVMVCTISSNDHIGSGGRVSSSGRVDRSRCTVSLFARRGDASGEDGYPDDLDRVDP